MKRHLTIMILAALVLLTAIAYAQESRVITYQGYMTDAVGDPIEGGPHEIEVSFFPLQSGGDPFMVDSFFDVYFTMGRFSLALDPGMENIGWPLWVEFAVDGETLEPRQQITQAAFSAVTQRVVGDILTAPGVLEVHPTDPCFPPDPCLPGVAISADSVTSRIKINWPDPPEMTSSAIELASVGNDGSKIWMYHPLADPPGPMIELNADPVGGSSIVIHSAEPLLGGSGIFRGTSTTGSILSLNHNPRPHEQVSVIELSSAPEDFGHIKMFNGRIEPPPVYLEMNTAYDADQTGSNFIMYNPDPANYGSPMVQMSTNTGGRAANASHVMFNPQPEPPGSDPDPFLEIQAFETGASLVMFTPQPEPPGEPALEISNNIGTGASLVMFNPQPEPPGANPYLEMRATEDGGSMGFYNDGGKYMGVDPTPFYDGGVLNMYHTVEGRPEYLAVAIEADASGGEIQLYDDASVIGTNINAGSIEMIKSDPTGINGPPISMETSLSSARIGVGTDSPTNEIHVVGHIRIVDGQEGPGKVLTSDISGIGTWRSPTALAGEQVQELMEIIDQLNAKVNRLESKIVELEQNINR